MPNSTPRRPLPDLGPDVARRFWAKTAVDDDGCQVWDGTMQGPTQGRVSIAGQTWNAQRVAYGLLHAGELREDQMVSARCGKGWCCDADHLVAIAFPRKRDPR